MRCSSLAVAALIATGAQAARAADPAPVVAAERAFAEDGLALGVRDSFLKHSAPEAIVFAPEPAKVHEAFPKLPPDKGGPPLVWWPLWAGIARSGDLGFTTGPYTTGGKPGGYYFTVWRKQADGAWKWIYDGGPPSDPAGAAPKDSPVAYLPPATAQAGSAAKALAEVGVLEARLNAHAAENVQAAFPPLMAPDGRIVGSRTAPGNTPEAQQAELATRPASITYALRSAEASKAGDLVWTWGDAAWARQEGTRAGHYVRIWQNRKEGWRLVYDALLPAPAKPAD